MRTPSRSASSCSASTRATPAAGRSQPRRSSTRRARALSRARSTASNGGFGGAPKFPQPAVLEFLLRYRQAHRRRPRAERWSRLTLDKMAAGGHLRPDRRRLPPLRGRRDLAGAALREDALRQRPARPRLPGRLPRLRRRALPPDRDRDARLRRPRDDRPRRRLLLDPGRRQRGRGGKFYVWTPDEIEAVLGADGRGHRRGLLRRRARAATSRATPSSDAATGRGGRGRARRRPRPSWPKPWRGIKPKLFAAREERDRPAATRRSSPAWNGLMLRAFAEARASSTAPTSARSPSATPRSSWTTCGATAGSSAPTRTARPSQRLPGGLRLPRRRPARPLRGDVRRGAGSTRRSGWPRR